MENQLDAHEQVTDDSPILTDQEVVRVLKEQRESQPETAGQPLPSVGESGEREKGEVYLTGDNIPVRHIRYEEVDEDKIPIAQDLSRGRNQSDGTISSSEPAQLHDDYHVGGGMYVTSSEPRRRLNEDEAHMTADIMKHDSFATENLEKLNDAVSRRAEIDDELLKLQAEYDALGDVDTSDRHSEASQSKNNLHSKISDLKYELRRLGRKNGESLNSDYFSEYENLDSSARNTAYMYIENLYQLNPDYFKDMPTSQFLEISKQLSDLKRQSEYLGSSPTEPGNSESTDLLNHEYRRRKDAGEAISREFFTTVGDTYTAIDYLKNRVEAGNQMTAEEIAQILVRYVSLDEFDEDVFSAEDKAAYEAISAGFYDRPPRETYQMYIDAFQKIGEAVKLQRERNEKKYEDFLEELKTRKPEELSTSV